MDQQNWPGNSVVELLNETGVLGLIPCPVTYFASSFIVVFTLTVETLSQCILFIISFMFYDVQVYMFVSICGQI